MKILITGATGLLGPYLMAEFSKFGDVSGVSRGKSDYQYDLTDPKAVENLIYRTSPHMIIHAAALVDVEGCEKNPQKAIESNCTMTENLVRYMSGDCRFIYVSTDSVYSGHGPHREHSRSENPINMYGMSKFMGEFAAAKALNHLIIRTNMYGKALRAKKSSSLVDFLLDRLRNGDPFPVFTDVTFSPLWTKTLAQKLTIMARTNKVGTFNLGASTSMTKAKFAMLLADGMGLNPKGIRPTASTIMVGRTPRPLDTRMDISRAEMAFGLSLPSMENDIKAMCEIYKCTN